MPAGAQLAAVAVCHMVGSPARSSAAPYLPWVGATRIAMMCLVRRQSSGSAARAAASGAAHRPAFESAAAGRSKAAPGHTAAATGGAAGMPAAGEEHLQIHLLHAASRIRDATAARRQAVESPAAGTSKAAPSRPAMTTGDAAELPAGSDAVLHPHLLRAAGAARAASVAAVAHAGMVISRCTAADHLPVAADTLPHSRWVQKAGLAAFQLRRARCLSNRQQVHLQTTGELQVCRTELPHAACSPRCSPSHRHRLQRTSFALTHTRLHTECRQGAHATMSNGGHTSRHPLWKTAHCFSFQAV